MFPIKFVKKYIMNGHKKDIKTQMFDLTQTPVTRLLFQNFDKILTMDDACRK